MRSLSGSTPVVIFPAAHYHIGSHEGDWEVKVPEPDTSVFLIPRKLRCSKRALRVKNGEDRLVVLNTMARSVIERQRGMRDECAFPFDEHPIRAINSNS